MRDKLVMIATLCPIFQVCSLRFRCEIEHPQKAAVGVFKVDQQHSNATYAHFQKRRQASRLFNDLISWQTSKLYCSAAVSRPVCKFSPHQNLMHSLKTFAHNGISCRECLKVVRVACNFCVILGYPILEPPQENPTLLQLQKSKF